MDWNKPIKDLNEEEIQTRRDLLIDSLKIANTFAETRFWEICMLFLKISDKYHVLAKALELNIKHWGNDEYYGILQRALEEFTVESDRDKELLEDVKKNCHIVDVYGLVLNNKDYDYDAVYKNYIEQKFYDKLEFCRAMYRKECKENNRKVNEFFYTDSDYEE